jgi:hypothetical protein
MHRPQACVRSPYHILRNRPAASENLAISSGPLWIGLCSIRASNVSSTSALGRHRLNKVRDDALAPSSSANGPLHSGIH